MALSDALGNLRALTSKQRSAMTAFNFFSHGTQDLYLTFLEVQRKLSPHEVGAIAVVYNIRAIIGGIFFA